MTIQTETAKTFKIKNYQVLIGDTFATDISDYVLSIEVTIQTTGSNYILSNIDPSTASLTVDNSTGYFNSDLSKTKVKILAGYNNTYSEIFRGFLNKNNMKVKGKQLSLSAESYIQVFKKAITNKEVLLNYRIEEIILRAFQECTPSGELTSIYNTGIVIPVCDLNLYSTWNELLKLLCESCLCVICYEEETFKFKQFFSDSEISQHSFTVDNISDLSITYSDQDVINSIIISSEFKSECPSQLVSENYVNIQEIKNESYTIVAGHENRITTDEKPLWKEMELDDDGEYKYKTNNSVVILSDPNFGTLSPISDIDIENGYIYLTSNLAVGTLVGVNYQYQTMALLPLQERLYTLEITNNSASGNNAISFDTATNITILCSAHKNVSEYNQGEEVEFSTIPAANTVHLVNTIEQKDSKIRFTLKNNTSDIITISTLILRGQPIASFQPIKAKFTNQVSIAKYGEKTLEISNDYIVSENQAKVLGQFLYQNLYEPIQKLSIPATSLLAYLILGKCTVVESSTGISDDYLMSTIKHTMQENTWNTQVDCIPYPTVATGLVADWLDRSKTGDYIGSSLFNSTIPTAPNSLLIQYNTNVDTSKNLALSWQYLPNDLNPIDGFELFISVGSSSGVYTVDYEDDIHTSICSDARGIILRNLPLKETIITTDYYKYYGFAIRTYRTVHTTIDAEGKLYSPIVYFYSDYKTIDQYTEYTTTASIEDSISGTIDYSTISVIDKLIKGLETGKTYDSSLRFDDFKGMRVVYGGIDRFTAGQIAPGVYGINIKDGNDNDALTADQTGITMGGLSLKSTGIELLKANAKYYFGTDNGIKIQGQISGVWYDVFKVDETIGNLNILGTLTAGSIVSNSSIIGGTISIGSLNNIFKVDSSGIYLGNASYASAPFRVSMAGNLIATSATISGAISGSSISGSNITSTNITASTIIGNTIQSDTLNPGTITLSSSINKILLDTNSSNKTFVIQKYESGSWVDKFWTDTLGNLSLAGNLLGGKTSYIDSTGGFFLGQDSSVWKLKIGNSTSYLDWDGSSLNIAGNVNVTGEFSTNRSANDLWINMIEGSLIGYQSSTATYNLYSLYSNSSLYYGNLSLYRRGSINKEVWINVTDNVNIGSSYGTSIFLTPGITSGSGYPSYDINKNYIGIAGSLIIGNSYYFSTTPLQNGLIVEGNVAIGTTTPGAYKLNVNGSFNSLSGYINGSEIATQSWVTNIINYCIQLLEQYTDDIMAAHVAAYH